MRGGRGGAGNLPRLGLALSSGLLLALAFPRGDLRGLGWVALVPLYLALDGVRGWGTLRLCLAAGLVGYGGIFSWVIATMHVYGQVPIPLSLAIYGLMLGALSLFLWGGVAPAFVLERAGVPWIVAAPTTWVSAEFLRSHFPFHGFPWALLGYSQHASSAVAQVAELTGILGVSFLLALSNAALADLLRTLPPLRRALPGGPPRPPRSVLPGVWGALVVAGAALLWGGARIAEVRKVSEGWPQLRVAVVQGNIEQDHKWDPDYQEATIRAYESLSAKAASPPVDLILWPETSTPFYFAFDGRFRPRIDAVARSSGADLLLGSPHYEAFDSRVVSYNSAFLLSPEGKVLGRYDKMRLVPFGEYVPLHRLFFFVDKITEGVGDFGVGHIPTVFTLARGKFGVLICYEVIFGDLARRFVDQGAEFLTTITNDAWFGDTGAPHQHLDMAAYRSVENRVWLARAANTGISAFVDPTGGIRQASPLFVPSEEAGTIALHRGPATFYARYGDLFALVVAVVFLLLLAWSRVHDAFLPIRDEPGRGRS